MSNSNFVDYVKIYCRSGKGGAGSMHLHREKFITKGGPDGGDGGRGGHIILRANANYWTLLHLKYARHVFAGHGEKGSGSRSFGKDGEDQIIEVPVALLGLSNPIGIIFAGLFVGYMNLGGFYMQKLSFVPEVIDIMIAIIIYFSALSLAFKSFIETLARKLRGKTL